MNVPNEELVFRPQGTVPHSVSIGSYPNGDPLIKWPDYMPRPSRILLRPRSIHSFMAALWWVDALQERGYGTPELILPIMPGSRQDRLLHPGDFLFTAKSVAREINWRNFPSVTLLDPHSNVTPALLDRSRAAISTRCVNDVLLGERYYGVISPDAGAEKRAQWWANQIGVPLFRGWKTRDPATGKISGFGLEPIRCRHYLVVDDICDAGGTFLGLAERIKDVGATADLFTTHGYYTAGTDQLAKYYRRLFCTDSVIGNKGCATVLPVCADLLREP